MKKAVSFLRLSPAAFVLSLFLFAWPLFSRGEALPESHPRIKLGSEKAALSARLGGELNFDFIGFDRDEENIPAAGSQENDFIVKRARLYLTGRLYEIADFKLKAALELDGPPIIDAYAILHLPWGVDLHAGQLKVPFSEERLRSYCKQPFMERGLLHTLALRRSQGFYFSAEPGDLGVRLYLGYFTGESLNKPSTDDDFEYAARAELRLDKLLPDFPGMAAIRGAYAGGMRRPERSAVKSFPGKTMNGLEFFSPVPVNGFRERWEADAEWRWRWMWIAGEWMTAREERDHVSVSIDTTKDGLADETVTRNLDPLYEQGWMAYLVVMLTGEDAGDWVVPSRSWGALGLALRYSEISFVSGQEWIPASTPGTYGRETSAASEALGRKSIDETARDFYLGLNWYLRPGIFLQAAAVWQWFDESSPSLDGDRSDINYRARVGLVF